MFVSILDTLGGLTAASALLCTGCALLMGLIIALVHMAGGNYTRTFVTALVVLPALVQIVIMMTNGNLGTGVAVLGAFSLVRFRSAPGSAREICSLFFAMAAGLACGMGYLLLGLLVVAVIAAVLLLLAKLPFALPGAGERELKLSIPETLDYSTVFDDLFERYTTRAELRRVRTANLGSIYELHYVISLKQEKCEKEFIDALRCRNGNLPILCGRPHDSAGEL